MKIFFGHTTALGAAYYRCMIHAYQMKKQGIAEPTYIDFNPKTMGNIPNCWEREKLSDPVHQEAIVQQVNAMVRQSDITVYQHFCTPMGIALLRMQKDLFKKPLLLDMDDYAFDIPAFNAASEVYAPGSEKVKVTQTHLKLSDGLIVSTDWLAKKYAKWNEKVYVVPNCLDLDLWDSLKESKPKSRIRIGHIGASGHLDDKNLLQEVVPVILKEFPEVQFVFVGDCFYPAWMKPYVETKQIRIIAHWETLDKYPQYLKDLNFDIGLAPLKDYAFSRGKSNLRYLEYSALRIPTIASAVEPFNKTITDGQDGYLVSEPKEWIDRIRLLIKDEAKRKEIGNNARGHLELDYNAKIVTPKYLKLLEMIKENYDANRHE